MSETDAELTRDFLAHFQDARSGLGVRLDGLNAAITPDALESVSRDVTRLRKELTEATTFLPSYDQRQCELRLKEIETSLETLRASTAPKPKFSFKRTKPASTIEALKTPAAAPSSASTFAETAATNGATLHNHTRSLLTWSSLKNPPATSASDLSIADLDGCVVNLLPPREDSTRSFAITALHIRNIRDSILLLPHAEGSALLHNVTRTIIVLGCHQYRMHTSTNVNVYLYIQSDPIIEHCSDIRFIGYPTALERSAHKSTQDSQHTSVKDFSHIRASPSPNWSLLPDEQKISDGDWPLGASTTGDVENILSKLLPSSG